jgi:hypothetical protein
MVLWHAADAKQSRQKEFTSRISQQEFLIRRSRLYHSICGVLLLLSVAGIALSLWVHVEALAGMGRAHRLENILVCQSIMIVVFLPIFIEIVWTRDYRQILKPPRWGRRLLWALAAYYTARFYLFVYLAAEHLRAGETWGMMSAGMILAFGIAAAHYGTRFYSSRAREGQKRRGATLPSP